MQRRINIRKIAFAGVVAASYLALTMAVAPISYGPVQFRIAEVLCILPFFYPITVPALFVGCLIANVLSPYGILDIVGGSLASLLAALCTMQIGRANREAFAFKALACFPPVIINALIIGAIIAYSITGGGAAFWSAFLINGGLVGVGQFGVLYCIGLPLMIYLPKSRFHKLMTERALET